MGEEQILYEDKVALSALAAQFLLGKKMTLTTHALSIEGRPPIPIASIDHCEPSSYMGGWWHLRVDYRDDAGALRTIKLYDRRLSTQLARRDYLESLCAHIMKAKDDQG